MDQPATSSSCTGLQSRFAALAQHLDQSILGQKMLTQRLLVAVLADGHILVEGAPGLAKTTAIKAMARCIDADFHRIQFTPDLLPADLTGTEIYRPQDGSFQFEKGPLFHNIVLADEVNRAPAKVQSALLEAMGERQITIGRQTYPLPGLFMVMATQNPIEHEGTFPLPEAQLDRFLMHIEIGYPDAGTERQIVDLARQQAVGTTTKAHDHAALLSPQQVFAARDAVLRVHVAEPLAEYMVQLVLLSRDAAHADPELARWIAWGASPRGSIALDRCCRAHAWLAGRDHAMPEDVHAVVRDVLRHRILPSYQAEAEGVNSDRIIDRLLERVALP